MTLDEYRLRLIERLRACSDVSVARSLLAEGDLMLANSGIKRITRDRFWETVEEDLEVIGEDAKSLKDPQAAALQAVLAAARARIARYRAHQETDADPQGSDA